jgi:hypothetical protein
VLSHSGQIFSGVESFWDPHFISLACEAIVTKPGTFWQSRGPSTADRLTFLGHPFSRALPRPSPLDFEHAECEGARHSDSAITKIGRWSQVVPQKLLICRKREDLEFSWTELKNVKKKWGSVTPNFWNFEIKGQTFTSIFSWIVRVITLTFTGMIELDVLYVTVKCEGHHDLGLM